MSAHPGGEYPTVTGPLFSAQRHSDATESTTETPPGNHLPIFLAAPARSDFEADV